MKPFILFIVLLLCVNLSFAQEHNLKLVKAPTENPTNQKRKAVVVGMSEYGAVNRLNNTLNDADYTETANGLNIAMVAVQGGTFTMGATSEQSGEAFENELPVHQVTLDSYYIGKYEVTQLQWKQVMGSNPSNFKGDNLPVENVSWYDIQEFITKLNAITGKRYRMPTEAEWEYAARGGNKSKGYRYSGSDIIGDVAWYSYNSGSKTNPVGIKSPNELGIYDMAGNVYEWCYDWYDKYSSESQINPAGASLGEYRVLRGGSWDNYDGDCRVSLRGIDPPGGRFDIFGFRLALCGLIVR